MGLDDNVEAKVRAMWALTRSELLAARDGDDVEIVELHNPPVSGR